MQSDFLPKNLEGWFGIVAIMITWTGILWRYVVNINSKIDKVTNDTNEVGTRLNRQETDCARQSVEITNLKLEQQRSSDDRSALREKVAATARSVEEMREEIRDDRVAVITMLHNSEKSAAERDAVLREQLARVQERLNIEEMVKSVVRNMGAPRSAQN